MKRYLDNLVGDIKKAHRSTFHPITNTEEISFLEEMEIIEKWVAGTVDQSTLSYHCGLLASEFPPTNQLQLDEIEGIIEAFNEMLASWHIAADIPQNLPVQRAYTLLIGLLDKDVCYFPGGTLHFDFCTGYAPDCELKEYCPCLQHWNSVEQ